MPDKEEYKYIEDFTGGLNTSVKANKLNDNELSACINLIFDKEYLTVDTGYPTFGQVVDGYPQYVTQMFYKNGSSELILITSTTFYTWSSSQSEWQLVSNGTSTTVNGDQGAGTTNLVVTDSTGFTAGELCGIILDDGSQHQTVIALVPDGTHVNLTDAIPVGRTAENGAAIIEAPGFSGGLDDLVSAIMWTPDDYLVFTNNSDNIQKYDGTTCEQLAAYKCRAVTVYENYLLLIGTTETGTAYPQRVRWCDRGDPTNFSTGTAGFEDLYDSEDFNLAGIPMGPYLFIYRERSIYRASYLGTDETLFAFDLMVAGEGPVSNSAVVDIGDYHLVFGNANIYKYDGSFSLPPIGDKIFYEIFGSGGDINPSYIGRVFGFYVEETDEAWFIIPTGSSEVPDRLFRYNVGQDAWFVRDFDDTFIGFGFYSLTNSKKWSDLEGSWLAQTWKWNERRLLSGSPTTLLCGNDPKQVYEYDYVSTTDNGVEISFVLETKEFDAPSNNLRFDLIEFKAKGTSVSVYVSIDGAAYELLETVTLTNTYERYRVWAQRIGIRAKYKLSGTGGGFSLGWAGVKYTEESPW